MRADAYSDYKGSRKRSVHCYNGLSRRHFPHSRSCYQSYFSSRIIFLVSVLYSSVHGPLIFIMAALCNKAGHYIFVLFLMVACPCGIGQTIIFSSFGFFLLSSFFFSPPNLSGHRLDVYHTYTHGVACVAP